MRSPDFVIDRFWLIASALAAGTGDVGAIAAEQNAHMHLVSLALEPPKKAADAVPSIVFVIFFGVIAGSLFAFDNEVLIGLGQFLEGHIDVDLLARACPKQIFLRFAKLGAAKNAHHALFDTQATVGNRFVKIDRNGAAESSTFRARAERIIETEQPGCGRADVEIAVGTVPAGGEGKSCSGGRVGRVR